MATDFLGVAVANFDANRCLLSYHYCRKKKTDSLPFDINTNSNGITTRIFRIAVADFHAILLINIKDKLSVQVCHDSAAVIASERSYKRFGESWGLEHAEKVATLLLFDDIDDLDGLERRGRIGVAGMMTAAAHHSCDGFTCPRAY